VVGLSDICRAFTGVGQGSGRDLRPRL